MPARTKRLASRKIQLTMDKEFSLQNIFGLTGKKALVTGSSRGIGAAIAKGLSAAGASVVLHGQTEASTKLVEEQIAETGSMVWALAADLSISGAGHKLVEEAERLTGGLDILIINASAQINANMDGLSDDDLQFQFDVNFKSTLEMLKTGLPKMAERGWGRVVNIGSINQSRPKSIVTGYAAIKAAQHNLIQTQAHDFAKKGVLLNTLAPGLVDTDRNLDRKTADPESWEQYVRQLNWMGRAGQPEEMVGAAIFLSSNACSYMTGESVYLTGGY